MIIMFRKDNEPENDVIKKFAMLKKPLRQNT